MAGPVIDDTPIREYFKQLHPNWTTSEIDSATRYAVSDQLMERHYSGEISVDQLRSLESQYGITSGPNIGLVFASIPGFISSQVGAIGSEVGDMYDDFTTMLTDAISTEQESGAIGVDERVWDDNLGDSQDTSIDLWDEITVDREVSVEDDIQVTDDIDVTEETEIDEPLFYYEDKIPDLNPTDDFEDLIYPPEYDIKEDDIEDLIEYPEQELDDAVAWLDESNPFDSFQEVVSDDQYTPDVLRLFNDITEDQFGAIIDLPTQTDDVFSDIVNQLTEDHMGVAAFQFFDSDNIIFDNF